MIAVMVPPEQTLGSYIKEKLGSRSLRALATYAGIGVGTASRLIKDQTPSPDADTLLKVAEYLNVPVENLYRLAGYMKETGSTRTLILSEIEQMLDDLSEESQKKIRDMIRVEWEYSRTDRDEADQSQQARKAS